MSEVATAQSTAPAKTVLTKADLKALRTCDSICFDHFPEPAPATDPANVLHSGIRAIKRGKAPFYDDASHTIAVHHSSVCIHGVAMDEAQKRAKCFASVSCRYDEEWKTIASLLKVGDELELRWVGGDNNGYLNRTTVTDRDENCGNAGLGEKLYHDRVYLKVIRGGKTKYSFEVKDCICPNNSARMIRY